MAEVVLFHSVLGLRPGVHDTAERLRSAGHVVHTPDLYDGEVFDDYGVAWQWFQGRGGIPELVRRSREAVADLPDDVVYAGFSNGGGSAELLGATRPGARGVIMLHAAAPLAMMGVESWPSTVPVQVHYAKNDPFRDQDWVDSFADSVRVSGAPYEFFEYPVTGHLISDASRPDEHDARSAELIHERMTEFLARTE